MDQNKIELLPSRAAVYWDPENPAAEILNFQEECASNLPPSNLCLLRNVWITASGTIISKQRILPHNLTDTNRHEQNNKVSVISLCRKTQKLENRCILFFDAWSHNYFHFLFDFLPKLFFTEQFLGKAKILLPYYFPDKYKAFLEALGYNRILVIEKWKWVFTKKLFVPELIFSPSGVFSGNELLLFRNWIWLMAGLDVKAGSREKIYISRAKAGCRKIVNENELLPLLQRWNFKTVFLEDLSILEQMQLFSKAGVVLSVHGAGLSNALFVPSDCKIIEIRLNTTRVNNTYLRLANNLNLPYYFFKAKGDADEFQAANLTIELEEIALFLKEILNGK